MADTNDAASKTEEASPRKLEEARKRGEVAKSADLVSWTSLTAVTILLLSCGGGMARDLAQRLTPFIMRSGEIRLGDGGAVEVMRMALTAAAPSIGAVMGVAMLAGVAGNLIQQGFIFSTAPLAPNPSRLSPLSGFQRLFGVDGLVHFLKSLLKILVVGAAAFFALRPHVREFELLPSMDPLSVLPMAVALVRDLFFGVLAVLGVIAALDWFWQRTRFLQRMRMTKEEQKEDFKQSEGDPHIKARIRQLRIQRARRRMMQNVPKATVVVMNPTHYAVALRYAAGETAAPVCVAKGVDTLALKIRQVAEAHKVPIVEDPPLARALHATVEVDEMIPREHYDAVAKVIGFVMQTAQRRRARR